MIPSDACKQFAIALVVNAPLAALGFWIYKGHVSRRTEDIRISKELDKRDSGLRKNLESNSPNLVNYLSQTDDVAGLLFESGKINARQLETIQKECNRSRKNELLVKMVLGSEVEDICESFLNILLQTEQEEIYLLCIQKDVDISVDHAKLIQENYTYLIQNMDLNSGLLDHLFQSKILTSREMEDIESKETSSRRKQELLSCLLRKFSKCFDQFVDALKATNQEYIASKLGVKSTAGPERSHSESTKDVANGRVGSRNRKIKSRGHADKNKLKIHRVVSKFDNLPEDVQAMMSMKVVNLLCSNNNNNNNNNNGSNHGSIKTNKTGLSDNLQFIVKCSDIVKQTNSRIVSEKDKIIEESNHKIESLERAIEEKEVMYKDSRQELHEDLEQARANLAAIEQERDRLISEKESIDAQRQELTKKLTRMKKNLEIKRQKSLFIHKQRQLQNAEKNDNNCILL